MTNSTAKVAIIGFGTIGSGVARLLLEHPDRISRQAGRRVELVRIVDADIQRPRNLVPPLPRFSCAAPAPATGGRA